MGGGRGLSRASMLNSFDMLNLCHATIYLMCRSSWSPHMWCGSTAQVEPSKIANPLQMLLLLRRATIESHHLLRPDEVLNSLLK